MTVWMKRHECFALVMAWMLFVQVGSAQGPAPARDWTTWGYDQQRTGWNQGETSLNKNNVPGLRLQWSTQLSTPPKGVVLSTLTAPLVVEGVGTPQGAKNLLFLLGADDTVFALDVGNGKGVWQKNFVNPAGPIFPATWLCSNTANDTPVIDKAAGVIFLITSDGKLRGLNLSDGAERMAATEMVEPFARAWSLNLIDHIIYTTSGRGCGQLPGLGGTSTSTSVVSGRVSAMDVSDLAHPRLTRFYASSLRSGGPWGRGGVIKGPGDSVITQTADGPYDPAAGNFGESVLRLGPMAARLLDSFTPPNWRYLNTRDLDLGSATPSIFSLQNRTLVAVGGKEAVLYLLDAADLGGLPNHSTPLYKSAQLGNDAAEGRDPGQGIWGALTTYETPGGRRFLYLPLWGPPSKNAPHFKSSAGDAPHGSLMAFEVTAQRDTVSLVPQWTSRDMIVPDPAVVANGVVYVIQTGEQSVQNSAAIGGTQEEKNRNPLSARFRSTPVNHLVLFALDAETGKQLYSSEGIITDWVHFSEPVVALGKVYVVTHDAHVIAFGLK